MQWNSSSLLIRRKHTCDKQVTRLSIMWSKIESSCTRHSIQILSNRTNEVSNYYSYYYCLVIPRRLFGDSPSLLLKRLREASFRYREPGLYFVIFQCWINSRIPQSDLGTPGGAYDGSIIRWKNFHKPVSTEAPGGRERPCSITHSDAGGQERILISPWHC